jgi:RNA polymerase sigma-70 factor, ECF subfamily
MDTHLVIRAQHGDKGAYGLMVTEIAERFVAAARQILRDAELAEDASQQALLAIWRHLPQLRDPERFDAWAYRLLVNACYTEDRKRRRGTPTFHVLPTERAAPETDISAVIDRDQLDRGFERLSIDHRAVVVLHLYLDLPLERVAAVLGIPVGTAHSRLHHAMRGLRAALDADLREPIQEAAR